MAVLHRMPSPEPPLSPPARPPQHHKITPVFAEGQPQLVCHVLSALAEAYRKLGRPGDEKCAPQRPAATAHTTSSTWLIVEPPNLQQFLALLNPPNPTQPTLHRKILDEGLKFSAAALKKHSKRKGSDPADAAPALAAWVVHFRLALAQAAFAGDSAAAALAELAEAAEVAAKAKDGVLSARETPRGGTPSRFRPAGGHAAAALRHSPTPPTSPQMACCVARLHVAAADDPSQIDPCLAAGKAAYRQLAKARRPPAHTPSPPPFPPSSFPFYPLRLELLRNPQPTPPPAPRRENSQTY